MLGAAFGCRRVLPRTRLARVNSSPSSNPALCAEVETGGHGIPIRPTWSVNELLSSYPKPTISPATLKHPHTLSALIPPEEGSPDHAKLTEEIQDLVKLVEAVKPVNTDPVDDAHGVLDGRIWAEGTKVRMFLRKGYTSSPPIGQGEQHRCVFRWPLRSYASHSTLVMFVDWYIVNVINSGICKRILLWCPYVR